MEYLITHAEKTAGKATVTLRGLYLEISCRCTLPKGEICRIWLREEGKRENLGVPVPEGGSFALSRRIPAKNRHPEHFIFTAEPKEEKPESLWIPVSEKEPFSYLPYLEGARFCRRENQPGVLLTSLPPCPAQDLPGSDRNP